MPLTEKGKKILSKFEEEYPGRGKQVFYASRNKWTIKGVDAFRDCINEMHKRVFAKTEDWTKDAFDPSEPRNEEGKWTKGGSSMETTKQVYKKPDHAEIHRQFQLAGRGTFTDYKEAKNEAIKYARYLEKEVGIEKASEFGKKVFNVRPLPKAENRYGHELRMEVVRPNEPLSE